MATLSLTPLATTIVKELPCLIERTLKYNVENNIVENQLVALQAQIDIAKRSIAQERKIQGFLREKIRAIQGDCGEGHSFLSDMFSSTHELSLGNTSIPSIHTSQPDQSMVSQSSAASHSLLFSDSPVSLRTKRKGIIFSDDVRISKKPKITDKVDGVAKENKCPQEDL